MAGEVKVPRGLATLTPERRREIAAMGGRSVPADKRSFSQDRELAAAAGRKGGGKADPAKRSFSVDREVAAAAGRKGGVASGRTRRKKST